MLAPLYRRFRRITTAANYQPEIDGLRFLAIGLVLLLHIYGYFRLKYAATPADSYRQHPWLEHVALNGGAGVELFFILSGFVLALPFVRHYIAGAPALPLQRYYLRRLYRIEPPYIIALLLNFAAIVLVAKGNHAAVAGQAWEHLKASLLYRHNFAFPHDAGSLNIGVWSLEVEVQFYLIAPLLFAAFRLKTAKRRLLLGCLFVLSVVANCLFTVPVLCLYQQLPYFLPGILLADVYVGRGAAASNSKTLLLAGLAMLIIIAGYLFPVATLNGLGQDICAKGIYPLVAVVLYYAVLKSRWLKAAFSFGLIPIIGGMCYSIYLMHYPIVSALGRYTMRLHAGNGYLLNFLLQAVLLCAAILLVCGTYYYLVERPFMHRRKSVVVTD